MGAKTWISANHFHFITILSGNTDFSVHMARHLHPVLLLTRAKGSSDMWTDSRTVWRCLAHTRRGIWSAMCNLLVPLGDEVKHATCTFLGGDCSCFTARKRWKHDRRWSVLSCGTFWMHALMIFTFQFKVRSDSWALISETMRQLAVCLQRQNIQTDATTNYMTY